MTYDNSGKRQFVYRAAAEYNRLPSHVRELNRVKLYSHCEKRMSLSPRLDRAILC